MTDEYKSETERIKEAYEALFGGELPQDEAENIQLYRIEQGEKAEELYRIVVEEGLNFATTDETGDVYVNTKWLGMIVNTVAQTLVVSPEVSESTLRLAEVLNQTIHAASKFVGANNV